MPKRGNWGDWAIIDLPTTDIKKVSCYTCSFYCEEDGSCLKTPVIPRKDNNKIAWKNCKYFELDSKYMTNSFIETVKKVKGNEFVASIKNGNQQMKRSADNNVKQEKLLLCDYEIGSWIKSDTFGTGRLVGVYPGKVVIDFQGKQRTFIYPQAFDNCLLFLVHGPRKGEETKTVSLANSSLPEDGFEKEDDSVKNDGNCSITNQYHINNRDIGVSCNDSKIMQQNPSEPTKRQECECKDGTSIYDRGFRWIKKFFGKSL